MSHISTLQVAQINGLSQDMQKLVLEIFQELLQLFGVKTGDHVYDFQWRPQTSFSGADVKLYVGAENRKSRGLAVSFNAQGHICLHGDISVEHSLAQRLQLWLNNSCLLAGHIKLARDAGHRIEIVTDPAQKTLRLVVTDADARQVKHTIGQEGDLQREFECFKGTACNDVAAAADENLRQLGIVVVRASTTAKPEDDPQGVVGQEAR